MYVMALPALYIHLSENWNGCFEKKKIPRALGKTSNGDAERLGWPKPVDKFLV